MIERDYIYGLWFVDAEGVDRCFYVGITNDVERRKTEHRLNSSLVYVRNCDGGKKGEKKVGKYLDAAMLPEYAFIREELDSKNIKWTMKVLDTVDRKDEVQITEDMWIVRMLQDNHPLQNSKSGDGERWERLEKLANTLLLGCSKRDIKGSVKKEVDQMDETIERIRMLTLARKKILKIISEKGGWKKGKKDIAGLCVVTRYRYDGDYRVYWEWMGAEVGVRGEIYHKGMVSDNSYAKCYRRVAGQMAEWLLLVNEHRSNS